MKTMAYRLQKSVKYLSEQETKLFFNSVKKHPRDHLLFKWMYLYGLRVSEAITLRLSDILPYLRTQKEIYVKRLKGGISRHFPIRSVDTIHLKRWLRRRSQMKNAKDNAWLRNHLTETQTNDILEIVEDRYNHSSTMVVTQIPVAEGHGQFANPTLADAIMDRIVHNA